MPYRLAQSQRIEHASASWKGALDRRLTLVCRCSRWRSGCFSRHPIFFYYRLSRFWTAIISAAAEVTHTHRLGKRLSHHPLYLSPSPTTPLSPPQPQRTARKEQVATCCSALHQPNWFFLLQQPRLSAGGLGDPWRPMRGAAIGPKILSFGRQTFKLVFSSDSENLKSNFEVKPVIFLSALQQVGFLNYTQNSKCSLSPLFEDL